MMSSTLGAPFGGTTRGGHHGFESLALCWITPPNFSGGGGSCLPSMVIVALGEPGVPLICCAIAVAAEPDLTLDEIGTRLGSAKRLKVGRTSIWRFYERHRITFKKNTARRRTGSA